MGHTDFKNKMLVIPAYKMKLNKEFKLPLSSQDLDTLNNTPIHRHFTHILQSFICLQEYTATYKTPSKWARMWGCDDCVFCAIN